MEYGQITKQIIDLQKLSFDKWYSAVCQVQDQATSMIGQSAWVPAEGRESMQKLIESYQQERDRFKSFVTKGFNDLEKYVSEGVEESQKAASIVRKTAEKQAAIKTEHFKEKDDAGSTTIETAVDILKKRLANGEISKEEYNNLRKDLQ